MVAVSDNDLMTPYASSPTGRTLPEDHQGSSAHRAEADIIPAADLSRSNSEFSGTELTHRTSPAFQGDFPGSYNTSTSEKAGSYSQTYELKSYPTEGSSRVQKAEPKSTKLSRTWLHLLTIILATCSFILVIIFVLSTYLAEKASAEGLQLNGMMKVDASITLAILRAGQGLLSTLMSLALDETFVLLEWDRICRPDGLPFTSLLSLSPTTSVIGMLALVKSPSVAATAKFWAVIRYENQPWLTKDTV